MLSASFYVVRIYTVARLYSRLVQNNATVLYWPTWFQTVMLCFAKIISWTANKLCELKQIHIGNRCVGWCFRHSRRTNRRIGWCKIITIIKFSTHDTYVLLVSICSIRLFRTISLYYVMLAEWKQKHQTDSHIRTNTREQCAFVLCTAVCGGLRGKYHMKRQRFSMAQKMQIRNASQFFKRELCVVIVFPSFWMQDENHKLFLWEHKSDCYWFFRCECWRMALKVDPLRHHNSMEEKIAISLFSKFWWQFLINVLYQAFFYGPCYWAPESIQRFGLRLENTEIACESVWANICLWNARSLRVRCVNSATANANNTPHTRANDMNHISKRRQMQA